MAKSATTALVHALASTRAVRKKSRRARLCKSWPRCRCIAQGYVNEREPNDCGRKPVPSEKVTSGYQLCPHASVVSASRMARAHFIASRS